MAMKGTLHFPKLKHYWSLTIRLFSVIIKTLIVGGGSYPSVEMQTLYSASPADRATGHSMGESYPSVEMQTLYSASPADRATGHSLGGGLAPL